MILKLEVLKYQTIEERWQIKLLYYYGTASKCHNHCWCQKMKLQGLKAIFQKLGVVLPHAKRKQSLFNMLWDSSEATKTDEDSFTYDAETMSSRQEKGQGWKFWLDVRTINNHLDSLQWHRDWVLCTDHWKKCAWCTEKSYLVENQKYKVTQVAAKPSKSTTNDSSRCPCCHSELWVVKHSLRTSKGNGQSIKQWHRQKSAFLVTVFAKQKTYQVRNNPKLPSEKESLQGQRSLSLDLCYRITPS